MNKTSSEKQPKEINSICVYCGSANNVALSYQQGARDLGALIADQGLELVYGGASVGLMGLVADSALAGGARVTGVMPSHLVEWELAHPNITELVKVTSMHERKMEMVARADAFVLLPGGLGTLDEGFEILTWKQLDLHDKPIIIANIDGYWDPLIQLTGHVQKQGFAPDSTPELYRVVNDIAGIPEAIAQSPRPKGTAKTKWM